MDVSWNSLIVLPRIWLFYYSYIELEVSSSQGVTHSDYRAASVLSMAYGAIEQSSPWLLSPSR